MVDPLQVTDSPKGSGLGPEMRVFLARRKAFPLSETPCFSQQTGMQRSQRRRGGERAW